jgi:prepilin-type N-terminal cleavage/methylation domain-containing protein
MFSYKKHYKGFTLIEILIVVAIIGILSAIVAVNFSVSQAKSRDFRRRADLESIAIAVRMYNDSQGGYYILNTEAEPKVCGNGGSGWFNADVTTDEDSGYPRESIGTCLVARGYLGSEPKDPRTGDKFTGGYGFGYMYYTYNGKYAVTAQLERPTTEDLATYTCKSDGFTGNPDCDGVNSSGVVNNSEAWWCPYNSSRANYRIGTGGK